MQANRRFRNGAKSSAANTIASQRAFYRTVVLFCQGDGHLPRGQSSTTVKITATAAKVGATATMVCWLTAYGFDLSKWPVIQQYVARVGERPKVLEAMKAEGLVK